MHIGYTDHRNLDELKEGLMVRKVNWVSEVDSKVHDQ